MTTKTIGSGGDYSDPATWEAAAPSSGDLVTAAQTWEGLLKNQEFTAEFGPVVSIDGTTNASYYFKLACDTGASFRDNANELTNALRYNASNGAGLRRLGTSYANSCMRIYANYTRIEGVQLKNANSNSNTAVVQLEGCTDVRFVNCILEQQYAGNLVYSPSLANTIYMANCLLIADSTGAGINGYGTLDLHNCTVVRTTDQSSSGTMHAILSANPTTTIVNTACFGFSTFASGSTASGGSGYNATDLGTAYGSTGNVTSATYADQFEVTTTSGADFRAKSGHDLQAGTTDSSYTGDVDIVGTSRAGTPTIGAWEAAAGGGASVNLTGIAAATAQGAMQPAAALGLAGGSAEGVAGALTPAVAVALAGSASPMALGLVGTTVVVALAGVAAEAVTGTLVGAGGTVRVLDGLSLEVAAGTLTPAVSVSLSGVAAALVQGGLTGDTGTVGSLAGVAAAAAAGSVGVSVFVGLTGVGLTLDVGSFLSGVLAALEAEGTAVTGSCDNATGTPVTATISTVM